jgi:hypothetical protein
MDVLATLTQDMKNALRGGDKRGLEAVRYLMAQVKNFQIDKPGHEPLTEPEFLQIVKKVLKNTEEAIAQYAAGGRNDLVEEETEKLAFMKKYLPQQLSDDELRGLIDQVRGENPGIEPGPLTGKVLKLAAGRADGSRVQQLMRS